MESYRGHCIYETFAGFSKRAFSVATLMANGVTLDRLLGDFATVDEAKSFIDANLDTPLDGAHGADCAEAAEIAAATLRLAGWGRF